jgi:hypothetical protein
MVHRSGPTDLSGDWYDLEDVISVARGPRQKPLPPDLDSLAGALFQNLSEIQALARAKPKWAHVSHNAGGSLRLGWYGYQNRRTQR